MKNIMKLTAKISLLAILLWTSTATLFAQEKKSCSFDIVGTWKAQVSPNEAVLYRFDSLGEVKVLSDLGTGEPRQTAIAKYEVVKDLGNPDSVSFTATG